MSGERFPGDHEAILARVRAFNETQFTKHGATPRGVGWNGEAAQRTRFDQLWRAMEPDLARLASVNDVGCGYGEFARYLREHGAAVSYRGYDISEPALASAREAHAGAGGEVAFLPMDRLTPADFSVASGLFALRFDQSDESWMRYVTDTLDIIAATSVRGFAFNMLTAYSDPERKRDELYYADPAEVFDLCHGRYSRNLAILHDYGLYDFTVVVRHGE